MELVTLLVWILISIVCLVSEGFFFAVDLAREGVSNIGIFVESH